MADSSRPPVSFGFRVLNRVSRAAHRLGVAPPLTPEALCRQAERATGLRNWGGADDDLPTFRAGLAELCAAVEMPPVLSGVGRLALHLHLHRALCTRLRRIAAGPPDLQRLNGPVIVVLGLPRSGTTLLHRLLATAPGARALALWEVQQPVPPTSGPDRRRARAARQLQALKKLAPDLADKHATDVDSPEECFFLLDGSLVSPSYPLLFPVEGYRQWRHQAPATAAYRAYRHHLLRLQSTTPHARLVLKAPGHAEHLSVIANTVPEAVFVQTHRDPGRTVPSRASLVSTFHRRFTEGGTLDMNALGQACLDDAVKLLAGLSAGRAELDPGRIVDIDHADLIRDPVGAVAQVHEAVGLPVTDAFRAHLRRSMGPASSEKGGAGPDVHGRHHYTAEAFGLTEVGIRTACAPRS